MKQPSGPVRHVVLVGAARSGTKILRDSLAAATGAGAVPYDIGYVWSYGAADAPDDALDPSVLTDRSRRFIARHIDRYAAGSPPAVIEKTVGNTLRVPFVLEALPDARIIHLVRNGVDVAESTMRQWRAPSDLRYVARKMRHFPVRLVPSYGRRYAASLLHRRTSAEQRVATWGPRYPGMATDLESEELATVCARQWRECVVAARTALSGSGTPSVEVRYEDLVDDPATVLRDVAGFAGLATTADSLRTAADRITPTRKGAGRSQLSDADLRLIQHETAALMDELGYAE